MYSQVKIDVTAASGMTVSLVGLGSRSRSRSRKRGVAPTPSCVVPVMR